MEPRSLDRVSTGIEGLDTITDGGLIAGRGYMINGPAGVGKTLLALHFLEAGIENDETVTFVNLEEDLSDLKANAGALGFDADAIEFLDLSPTAGMFDEEQYDIFSPAEVEQEPLVTAISDHVRDVEPDRVAVDPITQLRYLSSDDYQFRKTVIGFMRFLKQYDATVVFTTQETERSPTDDLQFISDGTILLDRTDSGRRISVPKFRGSATQSGEHALRITDDGVRVYPALRPGDHRVEFPSETISSGVPELDELLHGGLERGTVSIFSGPTGAGKTTLGTQFMKEAAGRGERSVVYLFEENRSTFVQRSEAINIPVEKMVDRGTLKIVEIEPLELSPQEFATMVRTEVEEEGAQIVMVDGIAGYRITLGDDETRIVKHLHAIGRYLKNMGVTTIFIDETADIVGDFQATEKNISYLSDTIVFLRHLELRGELHRAIGVLKKRTSDYERTLREFQITEHGLKVGDQLRGMRGILAGTPEFVEDEQPE